LEPPLHASHGHHHEGARASREFLEADPRGGPG
jgi:hypothetical protein